MRTEKLHYKLAESHGRDIGMQVTIWRSHSGKSWGFSTEPDLEFDLSMFDGVFPAYCDLAGFDDKFNAVWENIPRTHYISPVMRQYSPVRIHAKNFLSRADVVSLLEQVYYPVWKTAAARMLTYDRGRGWLDTMHEAWKHMDWEAYRQFEREQREKRQRPSQP